MGIKRLKFENNLMTLSQIRKYNAIIFILMCGNN